MCKGWLFACVAGFLSSNMCLAMDGESLFSTRCTVCHKSGAVNLRSTPSEAKQLLASGSIRQHRFSLSAAEIETLTDYLAKVKEP